VERLRHRERKLSGPLVIRHHEHEGAAQLEVLEEAPVRPPDVPDPAAIDHRRPPMQLAEAREDSTILDMAASFVTIYVLLHF
jgi:hypothetical protein